MVFPGWWILYHLKLYFCFLLSYWVAESCKRIWKYYISYTILTCYSVLTNNISPALQFISDCWNISISFFLNDGLKGITQTRFNRLVGKQEMNSKYIGKNYTKRLFLITKYKTLNKLHTSYYNTKCCHFSSHKIQNNT